MQVCSIRGHRLHNTKYADKLIRPRMGRYHVDRQKTALNLFTDLYSICITHFVMHNFI